jgi:pyruvate dehydrogenase E2 component (dihydrolipoamide acetyltransferase)
MAEIVMPRLSDTMEEGTILRWLKGDGEEVARGEELVEIETDKATMTYESDQAGVLEIVAGEGHTLAVGALIARVGERAGGNASAAAPAVVEEPAVEATARAQTAAATPISTPAASGAPSPSAWERVKASPLARRIAGESGIDLRGVSGSGPGGRIVKADVLSSPPAAAPVAASSPPTASEPSAAPPETTSADATPSASAPVTGLEGVASAKGETTDVELSRTQQTIARRMAESKATIPHFTLQADVDMEACVALRGELKRLAHERVSTPTAAGTREPLKAPTFNDMVVKAAALALREHPRANGSYRDGRLRLHARVNVGVAVAAEESLVVPTVFDADEKSLGEIAREALALAERVRSGAVTPPELGGGTFTVSNLGMYGIESFTAIINPPQAAILSVGSVQARAVVHDGELAARHTMTLMLACDHRILYGAEAAQFLARIRELLQTPSALTL